MDHFNHKLFYQIYQPKMKIFSTEKKIIFGSLVMVQTESKTFVELTLIRAI